MAMINQTINQLRRTNSLLLIWVESRTLTMNAKLTALNWGNLILCLELIKAT